MVDGTKQRVLACAATSLLFVLTTVKAFPQAPSVEYQVKAAFLFNFAKFIDWPVKSFGRPTEPFTFCLAGDPFNGELDKTIQGETLNGRPLTVKRLAAGETVVGCHTLYIPTAESKRAPEMIHSAASHSILTVGESADFIDNGGIIRFVESAHRVRFEINPEAADRAGLRVSSRLLRLAEIVHPRTKRPGSR